MIGLHASVKLKAANTESKSAAAGGGTANCRERALCVFCAISATNAPTATRKIEIPSGGSMPEGRQ